MPTEVLQFYTPARLPVARSRPLFTCPVSAGAPEPVGDYIAARIELNTHLIKNHAAPYYDIRVGDRAREAAGGAVVVARVSGEFLVKRLVERGGKVLLAPENDNYTELEIKEHHDFEVWGVVTSVIHSL